MYTDAQCDTALIEQRHLERHFASLPSLTSLLAHAERFGTDMIVESGLHLSERQQVVLAQGCKRMDAAAKSRRFA